VLGILTFEVGTK
jgi:hypothetical protein